MSQKSKFQCGQCGQDAAPKPEPKAPNAPADCPMMKARGCAGVGEKNEGKGGSLFERIKNFFGIGKEDVRLTQLSRKLQNEEHNRHHRDVFDSRLICRKDGYFAPLLTKVDCQGKPGCTCGSGEEDYDEEEFDEETEEEDEEVEYYEDLDDEEYDEDEYCEEDEVPFDVSQCGAEGGAGEEKVEEMVCLCSCGGGEEPGEGQAGVGKAEEECVEDKEGECIIEESAECMDPECKFFFEDPPDKKKKKKKKEDFSKVGVSAETDCVAMNNFIVRVQAPFSEKTTNETVEQIIARLTNKKPEYPEPGPKPEKDKQENSGAPEKEAVQLVVKQISVGAPTCECPPAPCKKKEDPPPPPPPPPIEEECHDEPPPPGDRQDEPPPFSEDECEDIPPYMEEYEAPPPLPNDCEILSEEELLRKPIKDIKCGGACSGSEKSVWMPPPPPPCPRCGTPHRGGTEDCYLCQLTRRMRSGLPEIQEKPPMVALKLVRPDPGSCVPEYLPDGSMKYKGGMCLELTGSYIQLIAKRTPPGGFFDRYTGECGDEARLQALTGTNSYAEAFSACYNRNSEGLKWRGGDSLENTNRYLWGLPPIDEDVEVEVKRVCIPPEKPEAPPSKDKCPAPPKKK